MARGGGPAPLLDIKNSPDGRRYAIQNGASNNDETGSTPETKFSGLVTLERAELSVEDRELFAQEKGELPPQRSAPIITPMLMDAIEESGSGEQFIHVAINLPRPGVQTLQDRMRRLIAGGDVTTRADYEAARTQLLSERMADVEPLVAEAAEFVTQLGGVVMRKCRIGHCLDALLTPRGILSLSSSNLVSRIDLVKTPTPYADMDGELINEVYQTTQFWDFTFSDGGSNYNYDGNNSATTDVTAAIIEGDGGILSTHRGFKEDTSGSRIRGMYLCTTSCSTVSSWATPDDHFTQAAGCLLSDLTDGQDSNYAGSSDREKRSAPGREGQMWVYGSATSSSDAESYEHMVLRSPAPLIVSQSRGYNDGGSCLGEDSIAIDADELLYEQGILLFNAAGNSTGSSSNCTVGSPATAIGVHAVGGWGDGYTYTDECDARDEDTTTASSWGGNSTEGKNRSIIGALGSYYQKLRPDSGGVTSYSDFNGTSAATPSIASSAINFIDMYLHESGSYIEDPGPLQTWMTFMGNRRSTGTSKLTSKFHHHAGAGIAQMRMLNTEGLDSPYIWTDGDTCVENSETVTITINGGSALNSDSDDIKAVIWWYDRRYENGTAIDDIDLALKTTGGTLLRSSADASDNKEMVYYSGVGGQAIKLEISGFSVSADDEGCGANSMKVYYAFIVEDSDRDDGDGPAYDTGTCGGVAPLWTNSTQATKWRIS